MRKFTIYELKTVEEVVRDISFKYPKWPKAQIKQYSKTYLHTYGILPKIISYAELEHYILSKMLWSQINAIKNSTYILKQYS